MRADADFMVYVAARWPTLVREAVLLGVPPEQAAEATADALSRCRRGWGRASQEEDVDALVHDELVGVVSRRQRTGEASRAQDAQELLVLAPPTLEDLRHQESAHNRAVLRRAAMVAVPLMLVAAGLGAYVATSGDDPAPPAKKKTTGIIESAAVSPQENPAPGVVWYADGQLHLDHAVLAVEGLRDMTRVGTGVVYGDDQGRVVFAEADGSRDVIGHKDPDVPLAATDENGWAAWVEPAASGSAGSEAKLEVVEASTGNEVYSELVDPSAQVVAVDGNTVYVLDSDGTRGLVVRDTGTVQLTQVAPLRLLDVRSRTRAFQLDASTLELVQGYFSTEFQLPGIGARLSPDGNLVATTLPGTDDQVTLYDTRSGKTLVNGLGENDDVLAFAPLDERTISYVVAPLGLAPGRELQLRTCDLTTTLCTIDARIPSVSDTPVLAR